MSSVQYRLSSQKVYFAKLQWQVFQDNLRSAEVAADYLQAECFLQGYLLFLDQALWAVGKEVAAQYNLDLEEATRLYPSSVEMLAYIDHCLQAEEVKSPEISRILLAQQDRSSGLYWLLQLLQHARGDDLRAKFSLRKLKALNEGDKIALNSQPDSGLQRTLSLADLESFYSEVEELIAALRGSIQEY